MHDSNNMTFNESMMILKSAESALEAAENAYKVLIWNSYLFIYEFLPKIASSIMVNCYQRGSCLSWKTPTNEPMELAVISIFTNEGLTGDRTRDLSFLSSTPLPTRPRFK